MIVRVMSVIWIILFFSRIFRSGTSITVLGAETTVVHVQLLKSYKIQNFPSFYTLTTQAATLVGRSRRVKSTLRRCRWTGRCSSFEEQKHWRFIG
jgi:hypothetical protein